MTHLLDTHAFLWFIAGSDQLSSHARARIEDENNDRLLSVAGLWEMAIKTSLGKLDVPLPFTRLVRTHVTGNAIDVLSIEPEHLDVQRQMPFHHHEPFDRLILAQAVAEDIPVISRDDAFAEYPVRVIW